LKGLFVKGNRSEGCKAVGIPFGRDGKKISSSGLKTAPPLSPLRSYAYQ
ncbi:MAG: hypothetical protein ACI9EW_003812, partial [Cellvibrionaceae bacterium]